MTVNGELYPLPTQERHTSATGGGSWHIPTPTSADVYTGNMESSQQSDDSMHSVSLPDFVGRFPTPLTTDADPNGGPPNKSANTTQWDGVNSLGQMAKTGKWPTPSSGGDSGGDDLVTAVDGSLSPDWVSWLMGIPISWTSLEPLAQEDYDEWFQAQMDGTWWQEERGLPRVATGIEQRVSRLKCLGNGIVPASLALFLKAGKI
jgi:hypothetical protein